jgi:uncharacterized protein YjbI with pentapeptide repeats
MPDEYTDTAAFRRARFRSVDLAGAQFRDCDLSGLKIADSWLVDVDVSGEIRNFR